MANEICLDWWGKASAGAILGLGLALSLVGLYAYLGPGGIDAPGGRYSLMRYLEVFVWVAVLGVARRGEPDRLHDAVCLPLLFLRVRAI